MAIDSKRDQTQEPGQTRGPGLALGWVGLGWTGTGTGTGTVKLGDNPLKPFH